MKKLIQTITATATSGLLLAQNVFATNVDVIPDAATNIALGNQSPENTVVSIINLILGILALIAVGMILYGGLKWMTSAGNEEKVEGSKKLLIAAVIGLLVILAAWGISIYAINNLVNVTGGTLA